MYADHFVPQLRHCWLRNVTSTLSNLAQGHQAWGTGSMTKVANGPFKWGLQHRLGLAAPGAGHFCGKQLPSAKQPCKAPLDHIGRHVAWCARRAKEIDHNRLKPLSRLCLYQGIVSLQLGKAELYTRRTYTFLSPMHGHMGRCQNWHGQT